MSRSLIGVALFGAVAILVNPGWAQVPSPAAPPQWPWPQQAYVGTTYQPAPLASAPTPGDAYKQGLINRWELERVQGPMPQALQGPSPDGARGSEPNN